MHVKHFKEISTEIITCLYEKLRKIILRLVFSIGKFSFNFIIQKCDGK